ncbi:hypothetical protein M2351_005068 [Azospirillum canadense]|nr:hypothetical protein [Azospirillum canadense]
MTSHAYVTVIRASARDRLDLFLATANWLGAPVGNIEKDFWVGARCKTARGRGPRVSFVTNGFPCRSVSEPRADSQP